MSPAHAVVLSVDEKSQIQALYRSQPGLPMKPGRAGTMTHDYKRHGTTTLLCHPQASESARLARQTSALGVPLHSDLGLMAQRRTRLLCKAHQTASETRRLLLSRPISRPP
jgi:hypothetical protein